MFGGGHRHVEQARGLRKLVGGIEHGFAVMDDRHQPALHVDDQQRGVGGGKQHVGRLLDEDPG
ncbi:hypothetical protein D9M69_617600 [compost metagenome]